MPPGPHVDAFSSVPLPVTATFAGTVLSQATGFLWYLGDKTLLVTNWHVVTGRNYQTTKHLHSHCGEPDELFVHFPQTDLALPPTNIAVPLYEGGRPRWIVHPGFRNHVDVCAIEVEKPAGSPTWCANHVVTVPLMQRVGGTVFIIGYPFGRSYSGLPVWKRGTFASEPSFSPSLMRYMLVDAASRPGMSGSPVIQREHGDVWLEDGRRGRISDGDGAGRLVGIYSGRLHTDDRNDIQLGIVWPLSLLEEIVRNQRYDRKDWFEADSQADISSNRRYG
jgi:hypothetical protein